MWSCRKSYLIYNLYQSPEVPLINFSPFSPWFILLYSHFVLKIKKKRNEISLAGLAQQRKFRRRIMPYYILYSTYVLLVFLVAVYFLHRFILYLLQPSYVIIFLLWIQTQTRMEDTCRVQFSRPPSTFRSVLSQQILHQNPIICLIGYQNSQLEPIVPDYLRIQNRPKNRKYKTVVEHLRLLYFSLETFSKQKITVTNPLSDDKLWFPERPLKRKLKQK